MNANIRRVIGKYVDTSQTYVFLFGSRASGNPSPASDYDIGLFQGKPVPLRVIAKIKDELEDCPIPVSVDVVDFATVSEDFKKLAFKKIRLWNVPKNGLKLI